MITCDTMNDENETVVVGVRFTRKEANTLKKLADSDCRTRAGLLYKLAKDYMEQVGP
jgi:hypothetical protein